MAIRSLVRLTVLACVVLIAFVVVRDSHHARPFRTLEPRGVSAPSGPLASPAIAPVSTRMTPKPVFGFRVTEDGGREISFARPELQFAHTAYADGRSIVTLRADQDDVRIEMSRQSGFTVTRGSGSVSLYPADSTEAGFAQMRALLGGSLSVRRLRTLVAALEDSRNPGVIALQLADAIVGLFDGDPGAPARLGRRFAARRAAGAVRVKFEESSSCWYTYEQNVSAAWEDYKQCAASFAIWNPLSAGCAAEWVIRVEGDWGEYLSCSSVSSLVKELEAE